MFRYLRDISITGLIAFLVWSYALYYQFNVEPSGRNAKLPVELSHEPFPELSLLHQLQLIVRPSVFVTLLTMIVVALLLAFMRLPKEVSISQCK